MIFTIFHIEYYGKVIQKDRSACAGVHDFTDGNKKLYRVLCTYKYADDHSSMSGPARSPMAIFDELHGNVITQYLANMMMIMLLISLLYGGVGYSHLL